MIKDVIGKVKKKIGHNYYILFKCKCKNIKWIKIRLIIIYIYVEVEG